MHILYESNTLLNLKNCCGIKLTKIVFENETVNPQNKWAGKKKLQSICDWNNYPTIRHYSNSEDAFEEVKKWQSNAMEK